MKPKTITYSILLVFSLFMYWLWRVGSPYPSILNWDIFEHQTVVNQLLAGKVALLPSQLTDTFRFNGYTTFFHLLIAATQRLTHLDMLDFWWIAELVHFSITVFLSSLLARTIFQNEWAALLGGVVGATIFESQVAYTSFFLLPQTAGAVLGILALREMLENRAPNTIVVIVCTASSLLMHAIVGTYVLLLVGLLIALKRLNRIQLIFAGIAAPLMLYVSLLLLAKIINLGGLNYGEAAAFAPTLLQKWAYFRQWYGGSVILIPLGIIMALISPDKRQRLLGFLAALSCATLLSPLPYALKFAVVGRFFINTTLLIPMMSLLAQVHSHTGKMFAVTILATMFVLVAINNINLWKLPLLRDGKASELSIEEVDAAAFLKTQGYANNPSVLLLSDPASAYILEATSGVNSQGGAYASNTTRDIAAQMIHATSGEEVQSTLSGLVDPVQSTQTTQILFVGSGRYFRWLDTPEKLHDVAYNVWRPQALTLNDQLLLDAFQKRLAVTAIYKNNDMMIFSIPTASYDR